MSCAVLIAWRRMELDVLSVLTSPKTCAVSWRTINICYVTISAWHDMIYCEDISTYSSIHIAMSLKTQWASRKIKIDWAAYEILIDSIYHSELTETERNRASMEALDAFTKRGHFDPKNYFTQEDITL